MSPQLGGPSLDDLAAVEHVLAGDVSAFEHLVRRWQPPLVNLAYRFCRDRSRAEDIAQEAFVRAYRALPQWRRESAFSIWLFALATNLYRNELRRIPLRTSPPFAALAETAQLSPNPETSYVQANRAKLVRQAVDTLPDKYRASLLVFYFQELDIVQAAQTLGLPEGTLKARLARGREMLRSKLSRFLAPVSPRTRAPKEERHEL
jgi:RNA polymerase sigma-70 factor (ECF subfamily)